MGQDSVDDKRAIVMAAGGVLAELERRCGLIQKEVVDWFIEDTCWSEDPMLARYVGRHGTDNQRLEALRDAFVLQEVVQESGGVMRLDWSKALRIYGTRARVSDDPDFVRLSEKLGRPELRVVIEPITPVLELEAADGAALLAWIVTSGWAERFERHLQGFAVTSAGESLLTGSVSRDEFREFIEYRNDELLSATPHTRHVLDDLAGRTRGWLELNVEEVCIEGYELVDPRGGQAGGKT